MIHARPSQLNPAPISYQSLLLFVYVIGLIHCLPRPFILSLCSRGLSRHCLCFLTVCVCAPSALFVFAWLHCLISFSSHAVSLYFFFVILYLTPTPSKLLLTPKVNNVYTPFTSCTRASYSRVLCVSHARPHSPRGLQWVMARRPWQPEGGDAVDFWPQ